jgi:ribosomal-protein-alanine N-acetyltransferase
LQADFHRGIIWRYYEELWNSWNFAIANDLLADDIVFHGSLGVSVQGIPAFLGYMRLVRTAFPDFHNTVEDAAAESDKVFARLTYRGTHRGELFGILPTNRNITYVGVAFFTIFEGKIGTGWVLGDALGVLRQLEGASSRHSETLNGKHLEITPAESNGCEWAASLMASCDPWKTLGRDLPACLQVFQDRTALPFVARLDGERCGFLVLRRRGLADSPYIKSIGVAEEFRNHGIGRRLIAFAENLYRGEARSLFVCVSSFNPRARSLYESLGYHAVGEFSGYIVPGHSEVLLEKRLHL